VLLLKSGRRIIEMNTPNGQIQSAELIFKPLATREEFDGYDELLSSTYTRERIFSKAFLPGSDVRRFGVVDEEGRIAGICGLKDLDRDRTEFFLARIPVSVCSNIRLKEVINVVIRRPYHGSSAFSILCGGVAEAAVAFGADLLVGITRASLLKSFVKFGLDPAVHEPLHLLGDEKINDFIIYYDFRAPGAVEYMRARTSRVVEQSRRMVVLRSQYLARPQDVNGTRPEDVIRLSKAGAEINRVAD
jgi:hypothetical protein